MKLKFITNACCIYEHKSYQLLCDPWLTEPIFDGSWFHNPAITTRPEDVIHVDAIYISHIHPDHLDPATLCYFRKDIPIITLRDKLSLVVKKMKELGFTKIHALEDGDYESFGPFEIRMFGPFTKHPHFECEIGNVVDSAILIKAGKKSILNTNDNTPDIDSALGIKEVYGQIDIAQLNYNAAGPYPACFLNLSKEEKLKEHHKVIAKGLHHMAQVAKAIGAHYTMPFAGDYKLGGGLEYLNPYLGTTTQANACSYLDEMGLMSLSLKENEEFYLG